MRSGVVGELAGPPDAVNTAGEPRRITPRVRQWRCDAGGKGAPYTFAASSFTVLTFAQESRGTQGEGAPAAVGRRDR